MEILDIIKMKNTKLYYLLLIEFLILTSCKSINSIKAPNSITITHTPSPSMTEIVSRNPKGALTSEPNISETMTPTSTMSPVLKAPNFIVTPVTANDCRRMEAVRYVAPPTDEDVSEKPFLGKEYYPMDPIIATFPVDKSEQLSPEEITIAMFCGYLGKYLSESIEKSKQLNDFQIEAVYISDYTPTFPGDMVVSFSYSVLPTKERNNWIAGNGIVTNDGWILRKHVGVYVQRNSEKYIMAYPHTG